MKNCKTFCKAEAVNHFKEVIQPTPLPHPTPYEIKPYYVSGTKDF